MSLPLPAGLPLAAGGDADVLLEFGVLVAALALLGRLATRLGLSAIPLYLLAGIAFGLDTPLRLDASNAFVTVGASIGVVLLLLMLGLEYDGHDLARGLRAGLRGGMLDLVLNALPGALLALALGWGPLAALLLGGATYVSSSGIIAKVLADLGRLGNRETPAILAILVIEDLAMAVYLPVVAALLVGGGMLAATASVLVAVAAAATALVVAIRFGPRISALLRHPQDEVLLLTAVGVTLIVAGVAEELQVSSAVGAFLVGIAFSGDVGHRVQGLVLPLRDLFGAAFFVWFGLQIDLDALPGVAALALLLALVTALTKIVTGWYAARAAGVALPGRVRAGATLVPRGEFSILIASLAIGADVDARLGPLVAGYVLVLALAGPVLARVAQPVGRRLARRAAAAAQA